MEKGKAILRRHVRKSKYDTNVYIVRRGGDIVAFILVYVDDVACFGEKRAVRQVLESVRKRFECSDIAPLRDYLGFQIAQRREGVLAT